LVGRGGVEPPQS